MYCWQRARLIASLETRVSCTTSLAARWVARSVCRNDGRKHGTFFFFNYEGSRQTDTATQVDTVPLPAFWTGDFSSLLASGIQLHDPFTTGRPAIPGNRLDVYKGGSLISPTALALHAYYPAPQQTNLASNLILFPSETST